MGGVCGKGHPFEAINKKVDPGKGDFEDYAAVHCLLVYCDYGFQPAKSKGWCPAGFGDKLDTYENAMMMKALIEESGHTSLKIMSNLEATKENVLAAIAEVGSKCDDNDIFFFFYSGHGAPIADQSGDEEDGNDEAMCLPYANGDCDEGSWLRDDEFSAAVAEVHSGQKLIICDCCHSGSMADFNKKHQWHDQIAISLCGCRDAQESAGMGGGTRGGAFTKCINKATREMGNQQHSVGHVFNKALSFKSTFVPATHQQDMAIQCAPGCEPKMMAWPFVLPK